MNQIKPAMEMMYGSHLAAEGIDSFYTSWERKSYSLGATAMMGIMASTVIGTFREAAGKTNKEEA